MQNFSRQAIKRRIWRAIYGAIDNQPQGNQSNQDSGGDNEPALPVIILLFVVSTCAAVVVCGLLILL